MNLHQTMVSHSDFSKNYKTHTVHSWFQTFTMFWTLYSFFGVTPRHLNFICHCFGTICLFHLHRQCKQEEWITGMRLFLYSDIPVCPTPSNQLRLFSSQTFSRINSPTISSWLFFLLTPPMKMEKTECSEMSADARESSKRNNTSYRTC